MTNPNDSAKNFGLIKTVFNDILVEGIVKKDNAKKETFKKYTKAVNENEILKTQFLVFTNIENKVEEDFNKALEYVKENIALFSKFKTTDIIKENQKLTQDIVLEVTNGEYNEALYNDIKTLIFTKKGVDTLDTIIEATDRVAKYIVNNKPKVVNEKIDLPNSMLSTMMVDKYNDRYSGLDEDEKAILKTLIESDDEAKEKLYSKMLSECIQLVNEKLNTTDLVIKEKLLLVKERLLNTDKVSTGDDFIKNISKLSDLKKTLKDN